MAVNRWFVQAHVNHFSLRSLELRPDLITQPLTTAERFLGFQLVDDAPRRVDRGVIEDACIDILFGSRDALSIVGDTYFLCGNTWVHEVVQESMGRYGIRGRLQT